MTTAESPWAAAPSPKPPLPRLARAYCGPAHGLTWPLVTDGPPPAVVDIPLSPGPGAAAGGHLAPYRLVHHPRTRRPVRDTAGSYLYMPVRTVPVGPVRRSAADVDVRLPVQQRVRGLVVQAFDEPALQSAFGVDAALTPR